MDETYIKMSDCEEIQGLRPNKEYPYYEDGDILSAHWPDGTSYPVEKRERRVQIYTVLSNNPSKYSKPIWLPLQHQLQGMDPIKPISDKCLNMANFVLQELREGRDWATFEQLWLAFVMKVNYKKVWSGTEWRNNGH